MTSDNSKATPNLVRAHVYKYKNIPSKDEILRKNYEDNCEKPQETHLKEFIIFHGKYKNINNPPWLKRIKHILEDSNCATKELDYFKEDYYYCTPYTIIAIKLQQENDKKTDKEDYLVISLGSGYKILNLNNAEQDYGKSVLQNVLNKDSISSLKTLLPSHNTKQVVTSRSHETKFEYFGFDKYREIPENITGYIDTDIYEHLGIKNSKAKISGGKYLNVLLPLHDIEGSRNLVKHLEELQGDINTLKNELGFIQRVENAKCKDLFNNLKESLRDYKEYIFITLPEEWQQTSNIFFSFATSPKKPKTLKFHLEDTFDPIKNSERILDDLIKYTTNKKKSKDNLIRSRLEPIYIHLGKDDCKEDGYMSYKIVDLMSCNIPTQNHDKNIDHYTLLYGKWLYPKENYYDHIKEYLSDKIENSPDIIEEAVQVCRKNLKDRLNPQEKPKSCNSKNISYKAFKEEDFNNSLAKAIENFPKDKEETNNNPFKLKENEKVFVFDKKNVKIENAESPIEISDIFIKPGTYIFVKNHIEDAHNISHLLIQALVSIKYLVYSNSSTYCIKYKLKEKGIHIDSPEDLIPKKIYIILLAQRNNGLQRDISSLGSMALFHEIRSMLESFEIPIKIYKHEYQGVPFLKSK